MCNLNTTLSLCTCAPDEELDESKQVIWSLYRLSTHRIQPKKFDVVGVFMLRYDFREENIGEIIEGHLNQRNCFDFEYTPKEDDHLNIKGTINYASVNIDFAFNGSSWYLCSPVRNTRYLKVQRRKFNKGKVL